MTVGGHDTVFETADSTNIAADITAWIKRLWPECVCEVDTDLGLGETFVYRSLAAQKAWTDEGRTEEWARDQIYLISSPGSLTVVVDDPTDPTCAALLGYCSSLTGHRDRTAHEGR